MTLQEINKRFVYTSDGNKDTWRVVDGDVLEMDCEDYALTVLFNVTCNRSWLSFWTKLIFGNAKLCYVRTHDGGGHAVLKVGDMYIDNWSMDWVDKKGMESLGHKFDDGLFRWYHVAIKLLSSKLN